jgi:hypothetical protein
MRPSIGTSSHHTALDHRLTFTMPRSTPGHAAVGARPGPPSHSYIRSSLSIGPTPLALLNPTRVGAKRIPSLPLVRRQRRALLS